MNSQGSERKRLLVPENKQSRGSVPRKALIWAARATTVTVEHISSINARGGQAKQHRRSWSQEPYNTSPYVDARRREEKPGKDVIVLRLNNITRANVDFVSRDLEAWLRVPIECTAYRIAGEQGFWMVQVQRHIWRPSNRTNTHQFTRRLENGSYIARCRHADGTPYPPQIRVLGRMQRTRDSHNAEAPTIGRQRISAYSMHSSPRASTEPETESGGRDLPETSRDLGTVAQTLLPAMCVMRPLLCPSAEDPRDLAANVCPDNRLGKGGKADHAV